MEAVLVWIQHNDHRFAVGKRGNWCLIIYNPRCIYGYLNGGELFREFDVQQAMIRAQRIDRGEEVPEPKAAAWPESKQPERMLIALAG